MSTTILYVDDEAINLMMFTYNFKARYNVLTGSSGEVGLKILKENPLVRVVISDMRMPGMDGIEFITRAKLHHPEVSYFILTGFDITEEIAKAIESNLINKYFRKPFDFNEVDSAIRASLGQ